MAMSIRNNDVEQAARELARMTGESLTQAILKALRERLQRISGRRKSLHLADQLDDIAKRCAHLPILDQRSENEILGYDEQGIPRHDH